MSLGVGYLPKCGPRSVNCLGSEEFGYTIYAICRGWHNREEFGYTIFAICGGWHNRDVDRVYIPI